MQGTRLLIVAIMIFILVGCLANKDRSSLIRSNDDAYAATFAGYMSDFYVNNNIEPDKLSQYSRKAEEFAIRKLRSGPANDFRLKVLQDSRNAKISFQSDKSEVNCAFLKVEFMNGTSAIEKICKS